MNSKRMGRVRSAGIHACVAGLAIFSLAGPLQAVERQVLQSYVVERVTSQLAPLQPMNTSARLHLAIGIPLRDQAGLTRTLQELYNPQSSRYQQWMTPQEVAAKFCATPEDYKAVVDWAQSKGLTVTATHGNRICVEVEGSVDVIQKAFNITLNEYAHPDGTRTFFAPNSHPTVDSPIPLATIDGLDNYDLPKPNSRLKSVAPTSAPTKGGGITPNDGSSPNAGSAPGGAYAACDFRAAYVPGTLLRGLGQNVGLLQYDDYYDVDISNYETQFGLPLTYPQRVVVNGPMPAPGGGQGEVCLDIEMVMSMAPGVSHIYVYEAPNTLANWVPLLSRIQTDNLCSQVSCSWSGGGVNASGESVFQLMAAQGMSFFNATGDQDAFLGAIPFPSMSPNITECGGTTLTTSGPCGNYVSETVWNWGGGTGSSGGWTNSYSMPFWQQGIDMTANLGSTTYRNVPDVALTGDNVYVRYNNGGAGVFGGTSCAAPLWAGFTALVNEQASRTFRPGLGFLNPAIYALGKGTTYTVNFHDTTVGNNQKPGSGSLYPATTGYDLCTGWGTPAGQSLINYLAGSFPGVPNGGFETGDLSFWSQAGNTGFTGVNGSYAHSGNYGGYFGPSGSLGYIYQELATVPGQVYLLSFWVENFGNTNNEFSVYCNGTLLDLVNPAPFGWTQYQFVVPANWTETYLQFGFRNDPSYFGLDDVTFTPLPGNTGVVPGLPINGGFETGNLAGWANNNGNNFVVSALSQPTYVHSGTNALAMGAVGADGTISQVIPTVPGQTYLLQFWLEHPFNSNTNNDFNVYWNGNNIYNFTNVGGPFGYGAYGFYVTATSVNTTLAIAARNDPDYFYIDDIILVPLASGKLGQAAYVRSQIGEPWGQNDNLNAMNSVFGPANWNLGMLETVDPAVLFSPSVHFVFIDGSDSGANALNTFIGLNLSLMQSWVSNGGNLFVNAAPNVGGNINLGFGVTLNYPNHFTLFASAANPAHPVVQGPFQPVGTSWTGSAFAHAAVTGAGLVPILNGTNGTVLAEMNIGTGHAMFGGMTIPYYQSPQPQVENLRANILAYGNIGSAATFEDIPYPGTSGIPVPNGYRGVAWNNFYYLDGVNYPIASGYLPGAVSPSNCGFNAGGAPASITSGTPFNLFSAWMTAAWNDNLELEVKGKANGVLVYDQTYSLSATAPTLLTFNMLDVTEVDFTTSGGTHHSGYSGSGTHFAIDNVSLSLAAAQPAGVDHFAFSSIASTQCVNAAFPVTINAQDAGNNLVSAFGAPVTVSGWGGVGPLIEGFESGTWPQAPWVASGGTIGTGFAHDGTYGLQDPGWTYRTDVSVGNGADILSMWVRPSSATGGRAYLGFGASAAGAWSAVAAPNANELIIQQNAGYGFVDVASVPQAYTAGKWYKLVVYFDSPTEVTAKLLDSDGRTELSSVTYNGVTGLPGGVAMRSFGSFSLDTIRAGALSPVAIMPNAATFSAGTWSGNVTVFQPENNMVLIANSGFGGPGGVSSPFRVDLDPPVLGAVTTIPGGVHLTWSTCPGGIYQVQYTTSLTLPITWLNLGSPITAGGSSLSINDAFSGPMRFYKIVMLP